MTCEWFIKSPEPCPCCKRAFEAERIGVSAIGWAFKFDFDQDGPHSEAEWRDFLADKVIVDEYDREYAPAEFWAFVDAKRELKKL